MDYKISKEFENFLRSRLKVRIEFLEKYVNLFPNVVEEEDFKVLTAKSNNLKNLDFASLYLLEIDINEMETHIQNTLRKSKVP